MVMLFGRPADGPTHWLVTAVLQDQDGRPAACCAATRRKAQLTRR
jgi:hypothetical protein